MDTVTQDAIRQELGIADDFDVAEETERRVSFIVNYARGAGAKTLVLGISGGIDSTTAGLMAQVACERLRMDGYDCRFIAVRLPYGVQRDEEEAMLAVETIHTDQLFKINIKEATDGMLAALENGKGGCGFKSMEQRDFVKGNIKARQRMIAQYAIASATGGLVIGTDHGAEALMGFFTKFGDGACDLTPLAGLTKRRVRAIGDFMGAPGLLVNKTPTADLEDLDPGKPDEVAYGLTYDVIDDYLEGKEVTPEQEEIIINQFSKTAHKRSQPVAP